MKNKSTFIITAALIVSLQGCIGRRIGEPFPEPRAPGGEIASCRAPRGAAGKDRLDGGPEPRADTLALRDALALALARNPELASYSWERRARESRALQERLLPNPELGLEVENFGGNAPGGALDVSETTLLLSQLFETGGKRSKRSRLAGLEADLADWSYEAKRLEIITETNVAFAEALAARERLLLSEEMFHLSDRVYGVVSERVEAGKVSPLEETKALVSRSLSRIRMEKDRKGLAAAMKRLASLWGGAAPRFEAVAGSLDIPESLPVPDSIDSLTAENPGIARWETELEQKRTALALAKARRFPDPSLSGGIRWFGETDDRLFVLGLSVPLPIFDRNQGGVREAEYTLARAREERRAAYTRIRTDLSEALTAMSSAHSEAVVLKEVAVPAAERAFEAASEGYRYGKFGFLDVLDAQKTFAEVRYGYIDAAVEFHRSKAGVERLIGRGIDTITDGRNPQ